VAFGGFYLSFVFGKIVLILGQEMRKEM
jgi:hypothetical protein